MAKKKRKAKTTPAAQRAVSGKISKLRGEGVPQEEAVARGLAHARKRSFDIPEKPSQRASRMLGGKKKKKRARRR